MTAAGIKLARCDGAKRHVGMTVRESDSPKRHQAQVAKNYLNAVELRSLMRVSELFGGWVERMSELGKRLTMAKLLAKLNGILRTYNYSVFPGYADRGVAREAERHVDQQLGIHQAHVVGFDKE